MSHFTSEEFRCRCGRPDCDALKNPTPALLERLDEMRVLYGKPLIVSSGIRCAAHNKASGGVPGSEHETGEGADLACLASADRMRMVRAALEVGFKRVGIGKSFVHVGVSRGHDQDVMWHYYPGA